MPGLMIQGRLGGATLLERGSALAQNLRHRRARPPELARDLVAVQAGGREGEHSLSIGVAPTAARDRLLDLCGRPDDQGEQLVTIEPGITRE